MAHLPPGSPEDGESAMPGAKVFPALAIRVAVRDSYLLGQDGAVHTKELP